MQEAFRQAAERVYLADRGGSPGGIGTMGERRLHAILKYYLSPDASCHEVRLGRYVADICADTGVFEIQTRRMDRLLPKLAAFLAEREVTVVYPVAREKYLSWIDPEDGTVTSPRKSPRHGCVQDCLYELYYLREYLSHPRFHVRVILCDMQEYRWQTGFGRGRKRRAPRAERIPRVLSGDYGLAAPEDYACLIPASLPVAFTAKEYAAAVKIPPAAAYRAVQVLLTVGAIRRSGKRGNAYCYERGEVPQDEPI